MDSADGSDAQTQRGNAEIPVYLFTMHHHEISPDLLIRKVNPSYTSDIFLRLVSDNRN